MNKKTIEVFDSYSDGLQHMKNKPLAFTGVSSNIQGLIKRSFEPEEICEVKSQLLINAPLYYTMKKRSQYSRAFLIGFLKLDESGLLQRVINTHFEEMPPCEASVKLYSVPFAKIESAFFIIVGTKFEKIVI